MLLFRRTIPEGWWTKVQSQLDSVLVDHAHLERKAATSAINLQKYKELHPVVEELNAIAIEELQHFHLVLQILKRRQIPFTHPLRSEWISGLMQHIRHGRQGHQVIDHLICAALIEGRSCEKFQVLAERLKFSDPELSQFYAGLVESEGNHYATYLIMARHIDLSETDERLDYFLDVDAELISQPNPTPILH